MNYKQWQKTLTTTNQFPTFVLLYLSWELWLSVAIFSGDENLDALPSNATMLAKSPPSRFGSTLSLDMVEESPAKPLNSLTSLFDASHNEVLLLHS